MVMKGGVMSPNCPYAGEHNYHTNNYRPGTGFMVFHSLIIKHLRTYFYLDFFSLPRLPRDGYYVDVHVRFSMV